MLYTSDADGIVFRESLRDHVVSFLCFFSSGRPQAVVLLSLEQHVVSEKVKLEK